MTAEPEVVEVAGDDPFGLRYSITKRPISVTVYEDPNVGDEEHPFFFWIHYHDEEADMSGSFMTLGEAIDEGRAALHDAWQEYVEAQA